jgi:hypothetical protein
VSALQGGSNESWRELVEQTEWMQSHRPNKVPLIFSF